MNRYLSPDAEGAITFRGGRRYRLLLVVNGPCDVEDVEEFLGRNGFTELASSTPDAWEGERPEDWPSEATLRLAANECPLRTSAVYARDGAIKVVDDMPIGRTGATLTVAQAWDYGDAGETTGAAASSPAPADNKSPLPFVGAAVAGLVGLGIWQHFSATRRMEKARAQMLSAETKAEQLSVSERLQGLVDRGYSDAEAAAIVDREEKSSSSGSHEPQVIYVMP